MQVQSGVQVTFLDVQASRVVPAHSIGMGMNWEES